MARERSDSAERGGTFCQALLLAGLLAGSLGLGVALAEPPPPHSAIARVTGFMMLPICLGGSVLDGHSVAPVALTHCLNSRVPPGATTGQ
jgi:hypothetical protein